MEHLWVGKTDIIIIATYIDEIYFSPVKVGLLLVLAVHDS